MTTGAPQAPLLPLLYMSHISYSSYTLKQAKPKDKVYTLSDGRGLQLRIKPNGSKLWLLEYLRPYSKKRTCLSFGSFPSLTLAEACGKRDAAKELLAKDIDPKEYRDENIHLNQVAHGNTLENIAKKWLDIKKTKVSEDHAARYLAVTRTSHISQPGESVSSRTPFAAVQ